MASSIGSSGMEAYFWREAASRKVSKVLELMFLAVLERF